VLSLATKQHGFICWPAFAAAVLGTDMGVLQVLLCAFGGRCAPIELLSIAIWIVVLLGLVEKVNINQTSDFR
jgi:hypothetical protein